MVKNTLHLKSRLKSFFVEPKVPYGLLLAGLLITTIVVLIAVRQNRFIASINPFRHHTMGETVDVNGVSVRVESFRYDTKGKGPFIPQPGNEFLILTIDIQNNTDADFELIPLAYFYIKDAAGNVYNVTDAPVQNSQLTGPILPHENAREEIGFEVPGHIVRPALYFERGTPDHLVTAIDLGA